MRAPDGQPLQTDTIAEAYWYHGAPTTAGLAANIAAHASGIAFTRSVQRAQRLEHIAAAVKSGRFKGVIK